MSVRARIHATLNGPVDQRAVVHRLILITCVAFASGLLMTAGASSRLVAQDLPTRENGLDLPTIDDENEDLTELSLEALVETEAKVQVTVRERLEATEQLTLQEGILGGHTHQAGEWMIGYRYSFMYMDGNRTGSRRVSTADVFAEGFLVSPTRMTMDMHMVHLMHAPSDTFTWMFMVPFKDLEMDHVTATNVEFTTRSEGIADISLSGFYTFYSTERKVYSDKHPCKDLWCDCWDEIREAIFGLTLYFPTGSIDERGDTPMGPNMQLPYPMQLGSGTYDIAPNLTYLSISEKWAWGAKASAIVRIGTNSNQYSLGDQYDLNVWLARRVTDRIAITSGLSERIWGNIRGADPALNPFVVPTARPDLRGGNRLDLLLGASLYFPQGVLEGQRLSVDFGLPLHQSLDGPQLETDWYMRTGWSWTF